MPSVAKAYAIVVMQTKEILKLNPFFKSADDPRSEVHEAGKVNPFFKSADDPRSEVHGVLASPRSCSRLPAPCGMRPALA